MSIVKKIAQRLLYWDLEAYMCFRKAPEETIRHPLHPSLRNAGWQLREANQNNENDIERLARLFTEAYTNYADNTKAKAEILRAFSSGDKCFVLANDFEFGAMVWLGLEQNHMLTTVGSFIEDKRNACVDHRSYASPKVRGFGVQKSINSLLSKHAWDQKKTWIYGFVGVKNTASINNCLKSFDEVRLVYYLRIELLKLKLNLYPKLKSEKWQKIIH